MDRMNNTVKFIEEQTTGFVKKYENGYIDAVTPHMFDIERKSQKN